MFVRWFLDFEQMKRLSLKDEIKRLEIEYRYFQDHVDRAVIGPSWMRTRESGEVGRRFDKWGEKLDTCIYMHKFMLSWFNTKVCLPSNAYPLYMTDEGKCDPVLQRYDKMFVRNLATLHD